mgnify:CR=1 FL=1
MKELQKRMFHHKTDLYVYATSLTKKEELIEAGYPKSVDEYCKEKGFNREWHCPIFKDQLNEFADADFINDEEKMSDFKVLSKEEFLESYDYITEEEYNNTYNKYYWRNKQ